MGEYMDIWLVVEPTHLKNMSQNGHLPHIEVKMKKYLKPPPKYLVSFRKGNIEYADVNIY